jgi:hypothetical protein
MEVMLRRAVGVVVIVELSSLLYLYFFHFTWLVLGMLYIFFNALSLAMQLLVGASPTALRSPLVTAKIEKGLLVGAYPTALRSPLVSATVEIA